MTKIDYLYLRKYRIGISCDHVGLIFGEQNVSLVCENVYEVNDYPTTAFVFELAPETDVGFLARYVI